VTAGKVLTAAEALAFLVAAYLLWQLWDKLTSAGGSIATAIASAFDNNIDPAHDPLNNPGDLPFPNPTNLDEELHNSTVTGVPPAGVTPQQWIDYETTGVFG